MKKTENNYVTSMEFTNALNKYIPSLVLQQWITKVDQQQINLPELQPTETVVLFADISGFTMISEACALMGVRGNEELAFCINRYMEGMVKSLGKYGGDIIKFVGDAMIVMWPRFTSDGGSTSPRVDKNKESQKQVVFKDQLDDRVTVVRKAIQCAIDIQNELNNKKIMSNIGIGFGQCALLYVGGVFNRSEFFTVGDALTQALKSEENATAGGQIIVSSNAWNIVQDFFKSEEIINEHGGKFYKISGLVQGIRTRADAVLLRNLIQADNFAKIQNKLKSCIPAAIMPYLEIGYEQYGSETRRLTVMFASLGVDLSSAQTDAGMKKIQKIVTTVQQQVYRLEGSLNKLVMDDKGSTLICIWGLCPFSHDDDAARAILTAINMRRELAKIENTWCNVGISTGEVFSGVVGTSGSRKEFSVLGDYVNLAARIMYWPKKYKQTGKINVDLQTKKEADNFIRFNYKGHCEFKGKSVSLPIFEPIDPEEEASLCIKKVVPFDTFLRIHSNPFLVDRMSEHKRKNCRQIGRENLLHKVCDELIDFFENDPKSSSPYFLAIMGEIGSGKTLFARCIFDQLKKKKDFLRDEIMGPDFKPILTSSINAESQMRFLNIWRPILQMMMFIHCKKNHQSPEKVILRIIKSQQSEIFDIILDIFQQHDLKKGGIKLPLADDPIQFVKREKYTEDLVDGTLDFLIEFIKEVLGEKDDYYSEMDQSQLSDEDRSRVSQNKQQLIFVETPMIVILDTAYLMDEASWRLLELIKDECNQIAIILLMQTDTNNMAKIHPEARTFYNETFGNHLELFKIIDLPPFKVDELHQMIQELSSKYVSSMTEEIHMMTLIDDPATSIKNPEVCKAKEKELKKKMLVNENFQLINDEILQIALQRCEGNPMICLNFIFNLMANDFLQIKDQCLQPTTLFKKCKQRLDWSTVPVPGITQKINTTLIDSFIKEMRSKLNKVDSENAIKGVLLLKSAAVIGEVFGSKILQHISPLRNETHKSILQVLKILEQKDFIEILDETDPKNVICRFRKCFLRETIYQIMLYRAQKKGLHQLMVQFIQNNPNSFDNDPEQEAEKLLNHILIAEDLDSEDKVPFKSKQGLIVKKIANKLMKNPNTIVKSGYLTKQGDKPNKKVEKRLMIIKAKEISWYHNEKEFKAGKPLGVIYMTSIYHCVPANTAKSTDDLNIGTCAWRKKEIDKEGKREFIFGAKDEQERDEWISCIEYLRAKAIYDNFVQKYCNITFPLRRPSEEIQADQRENFLQITSDFGMKLKTSSRFNKPAITADESTSLSRLQQNSLRNPRVTTKIGSFAAYNLQQVNESTYVSAVNNPKDIAAKLKKLYNFSVISFINQVAQNSNKQSINRCDTLKKVPDVLKNSSLVNFQEESNQDIHQGSITGSKPSFIMNQSNLQNLVDDTMQQNKQSDTFLQIRELRRISAIAKREIFDDSKDLKNYLEEMKSVGLKSPKKTVQQNKITEENNEDDNSDESINSSSLPRKSAISDLTAKSGSPNQNGIIPQSYYTQNDVNNENQFVSKRVDQKKNQKIAQNQKLSILQTQPLLHQQLENECKVDPNAIKKSRMSRQLELSSALQKQRELTFHKQGQDEQNTNNDHAQQIFALSVNPTQQGKTPKKSISHFEQIEEQDELQREIRKNERRQTKKKAGYEASNHSSSSSSSEQQEESVMEDDEHEQKSKGGETNRDTGNFSQIEPHEFNSHSMLKKQSSQNMSNLRPSKDSLKLNYSIIQKQDSMKQSSKLTSEISKKHTTQNSKDLKDLNNNTQRSESTQQNSQPIQQVQQIQNISEIIAQTIQDQVSKSFQQMMQQVQKMTQMKQQDTKTPSPPYNRNDVSKRDSSQSKSINSSIYDEEWRNQQILRGQMSGGAASSKKISLQQAIPKSSNLTSTNRSPYLTVREKPQREETEVDDDDEYAKDPLVEQEYLRMQKQNNRPGRNDQENLQAKKTQNNSRPQRHRMIGSQDYSDPQLQNINQNRRSETRPAYQTQQQQRQQMIYNQSQPNMNQNYNAGYSQSNLTYSPSTANRRQQDYSPLSLTQNQNPYGSSSHSQFAHPIQNQYNHPMQYPQFNMPPPPGFYDPNYMALYQQRQLMDNELFNLDDQFDVYPTAYTNTNNQFISDISSIIGGETLEPLNQFAIVLEDTQCQLKGDLIQLYEGDKVEVLKIMNELGCAECRFNNQIGMFQLSSLKLIKRNNKQQTLSPRAQNTNRDSSSQRHFIDQDKSRKPPKLNYDPKALERDSQAQNFTQKNDLNSRQNFFKQNAQDGQRSKSPLVNQKQQNTKNGANLKLNDRKNKKQRQDKDSAERFIEQLNM